METVEAVIAHFGVRGMKWGVRKNRKQIAKGPKSEEAAKVHDILGNIHKNGIGAASNADLKMLESRIKLETKFNELFPKKKSVAQSGFELAKKILLEVGETQAKGYLNKQVGGAVTRSPLLGAPKTTTAPGAKPKVVDSVLNSAGSKPIKPSKPYRPNFGYL